MKTSILGAAVVVALMAVSTTARADSSATVDLTPQLRTAGLDIDGLYAVEVGGIVILRGRTADIATAQRAGALTTSLGYSRVANLIQVVEPPDDAQIERTAERRLALQRALDGCNLRVDSKGGMATLTGKVQSEIQKDVALDIVRNIDGVRGVRAVFRP